MSSVEFAEWMAYDRHDPIGSFRSDLQMAILARAVTVALLGSKNAPTISDFIPKFWKPEDSEAASPEETPPEPDLLAAKINAVMRKLGGKPKPSDKEA